jgi:hypothetical protein
MAVEVSDMRAMTALTIVEIQNRWTNEPDKDAPS